MNSTIEWRQKRALMLLSGRSLWDIDIERDKFFDKNNEKSKNSKTKKVLK